MKINPKKLLTLKPAQTHHQQHTSKLIGKQWLKLTKLTSTDCRRKDQESSGRGSQLSLVYERKIFRKRRFCKML